ncbi:hypothetical protein ACROYT_G000653 [Oculina patagonica]
MTRRPQTFLFLSTIIIVLAFQLAALKLPYEVLNSIVELSDLDRDFKDLTRVNVSDDRGTTRPIYRLDLDPNYVAYYEIDTGSDYVVLSSGKKTGDFRKVESGPDPRPTDVLIQQAQENGQRCEKFYRLSPMGLTICKNDNGNAVAASYNWTADVAEIEDWRQLDQMVKQSFDSFKSQWQERAAYRRTKLDWATTDVFSQGRGKKKKDIAEEALLPGSITKLALGESFRSADVYITNIGNLRMRPRSPWQQKLCKVLVDVCKPDGSTKVNPSAIKEAPNHLLYLKLEVHSNRTFVGNVLQWREIGFVVDINEGNNEVARKHFAINLHSKRSQRSSWSTVSEVSVPSEKDFPDYDQHICCGGCHSGSGPVAWAQVFGYYDRLAASRSSKFSPRLYGDSNTKAPLRMTNGVRRFVESIRPWVQPVDCKGTTYSSNMHLIAPWFRARQGTMSRVVSYLESRKRRNNGASVSHGSKSLIESQSVQQLDRGFPVVFEIKSEGGSRQFVVATRYKKNHSRYRERDCRDTKTGWWWGEKDKYVCEDGDWKDEYHYELFLHYGWGGYYTKWQQITAYGAHVAYVVN